MHNNYEWIDKLLRANAGVHTDKHFVFTGGTHGDGYANCRFLTKPEFERTLRTIVFQLFLKVITQASFDIKKKIVVVGPETLGATMVRYAAEEFKNHANTDVHSAVFTARKHRDGAKTFEWGIENPPVTEVCKDAQMIWMDDLLNASSTFQRTRPLIEGFDQNIVLATIVDRSGLSAEELDVWRSVSLLQYSMPRYPESECPFCKKNVPIVSNLGHGAKFMEMHPNYPGGYVTI